MNRGVEVSKARVLRSALRLKTFDAMLGTDMLRARCLNERLRQASGHKCMLEDIEATPREASTLHMTPMERGLTEV